MPCDRTLAENETVTMRKETIREKTEKLSKDLASGKVKVVIGPQGAIAFQGWTDRGPVTDVCAYRRLMSSSSALAKQAILKAEQLAGRSINKQVIGQGAHSHDGGINWHSHKD